MLRFSSRWIVAGAVVAGLFACVSCATAQTWTKIGSFSANFSFRCAYFWDTAHGVVGGDEHIYYYNSGTWKESTYPETPAVCRSLRLLDGKNLYAASGSSCVWKSTDSGATWELTSATLVNADDIYLDANGQIQGMNLAGSGMMRGTSFARINPLSCAAARDDQTENVASSDGGENWAAEPFPYPPCGYNMAADTCSGTFYTVTDGDKAVFYASTSGGMSWIERHDFSASAHDILEGANNGVLYVQGLYSVFRSANSGATWESVGGPASTLDDQRMFAFGRLSRYLIDPVHGDIWLWDQGSNPSNNPIVSPQLRIGGGCLFTLTVTVDKLSGPSTLWIHASTKNGSILTPVDTSITGSGGGETITYLVQIPKNLLSETFYFRDSGFESVLCAGIISQVWDTSFTLAVPLQPKPVFSDSISSSECSLSAVTIIFDQSLGPDSVYVHGFTKDGSSIFPADTTMWLDGTTNGLPIRFSVSLPQGQESGRFYFHDSAWSEPACRTPAIWDTSIAFKLNPKRPEIYLTPTVKLKSCSTALLPLTLTADACDTIWVDSIKFLDSNGLSILGRNAPDTILPGGRDTFWIAVSQAVPGTYYSMIVVFGHSLWSGGRIDTFENLIYVTLPDPASPRTIAPNSMTVSGCRESLVPLILQSLPCDSIQFTSCTLTLSDPLKYSTNLSFSRTLAAGEVDTLLIDFPPQGLNGAYVITAHIRGKYLGSVAIFDTTVQIRVTFTSSAGALVASDASIALDTLNVCSEADTLITLRNLGCDSITVTGDGTSWQDGWSADDPQFPFSLPPDSSFRVRIHFTPSGPAWSQQQVEYSFDDIGGKPGTNLPLFLTINAISAPATLSLSETALDFGPFSRCNAAGDTEVTLTNTGCDSLALSGAAVAAGTGFTLVSGGDTVLAPNESVEYRIAFADSLVGKLTSTLTLHAAGLDDGRAFDTTIALSATIVPGTKLAALNRQAIDFGTTSICEERDSSITLTNTGCEPDTITAISFANAFMSFAPLPSLPLIIPVGEQTVLPILTSLDTVGHPRDNRDTIDFSGNLDEPLLPVILSRGIDYPGSFALHLAAEDSAPIRALVPVYILRLGTVPTQASEVDFDLIYDNDLLSYQNPIQSDIYPMDSSMLANGLTERSFAMRPASDRDTIATLLFQSYLAKNERTPITLSGQKFVAGGETSPPCVASLDTSAQDAGFTLELACGDAALTKTMQNLPVTIIAIAATPEKLDFTLARGDARYSSCNAEVLNVLGAEELQKQIALDPATEASFDLHTLPAGAYFLRVSSGGYVVSRRFVVMK